MTDKGVQFQQAEAGPRTKGHCLVTRPLSLLGGTFGGLPRKFGGTREEGPRCLPLIGRPADRWRARLAPAGVGGAMARWQQG